jgi:hypothetical protein
MKPEIYISTDVETDGPIPGPHSMLSFGSAACTPEQGALFCNMLKANLGAK